MRAGQMDGRMCSSVEVSGVRETVPTVQTRRDGHGAFHTGSISVHHCGWFVVWRDLFDMLAIQCRPV